MSISTFIFNVITNGPGLQDLGLAAIRVAVGLFFAISGYHKIFNHDRHARLVNTLTADKVPSVGFMQWWVPIWEFTSGAMLLIGFLSVFNSIVLIIICLVACCCESKKKVESYKPIDKADCVDDYLYLPEVLYIVMLLAVLLSGSGRYSIDHLFF